MRHAAWQRAIDVQLDTHKWNGTAEGALFNHSFFVTYLEKMNERNPDKGVRNIEHTAMAFCSHLQETLWRGDTIYVTADMQHLMMQAAHDLDDSMEFDNHVLMGHHGFMLFEEPMVGTDKHGEQVVISALSWEHTPLFRDMEAVKTAIILYFFVDPYDPRDVNNEEMRRTMNHYGIPIPPLTIQHAYPAMVGEKIPSWEEGDDPNMELMVACVRLFWAAQLLSHQKIGAPVVLSPDRATRKRIQREWADSPERMITLITLRRKRVEKEGEPGKVEWSRRWLVRGHWRRQWYPKAQRHDWVYIHEQIRGPEDKPLIITDRRVFDFRR